VPSAPTVAVDAGGADLGPAEVAAGAALAAREGIRVLLFGDAEAIGDAAGPGVEVVHAPVSIAKAADPARAVRGAPDASIVQAAKAVASGDADALVSGGSTGAALAAGVFTVKRARGVHRPALAAVVPVPGHPVTLLDVGASTEARPEHLVQFAYFGAALATVVLGVARPRVALLSNGEEAVKGTPLVVEAHEALAARAGGAPFEWVGNVEGTSLLEGAADVVVTDGFTGNVALKLMEGTAGAVVGAVRDAARSGPRAMAGGLLLRGALGGLRASLDAEEHGGAYLLGLRRLGVVPHGRFSRRGFARAIVLAGRGVEGDLVGRTHAQLEAAGALRAASSGAASSVPADR
jgi:glycerol-3-phosphate acyltransferase PlsX